MLSWYKGALPRFTANIGYALGMSIMRSSVQISFLKSVAIISRQCKVLHLLFECYMFLLGMIDFMLFC